MPRLDSLLPRLLLIAIITVACWIVHNVAYVTSYRLYISHRADEASRSKAAQRFDIEGLRVVPQIAMRDDDRIAFKSELGRPSTLHVELRPVTGARYEIHWRHATGDRILAAGEATSPTSPVRIVTPIPADAGVLELVSHGRLTWVDPRLVRDLRVAPHALALSLLILASIAVSRRRDTDRIVWFRRIALAASAAFTIGSIEIGLRALGDRVPLAIATERHDLGEARQDPRWEDTLRYGRRLRVRVDAVNEWRHGDIVRMGFIPPDVSDGVLYNFRFQTDDEGFRNASTRERIDAAALGDSFTDAMTIKARDAWTSVLERRTGLAVQNYGTAGFGPQQELRVLTDYAVRHRPKVVVLAYFAGNDLFDAEAFDEFERSQGAVKRPVPGWQIKDVVSRADNWFVVSALRAAGAWASRRQSAEARPIAAARPPRAVSNPLTPVFDRGMFTATVNGQELRWAFMPPYLETLNFSEDDLAARPGWTMTTRAIAEMQAVSRGIGAELVVMFLPFKSQVYLPLLAGAMPPSELSRALEFYLPDNPGAPDVAAMLRNRLAQNRLMRRFCVQAGIRWLDTTGILEARVRAGENVYFPDESHLNEIGHAAIADALAGILDR